MKAKKKTAVVKKPSKKTAKKLPAKTKVKNTVVKRVSDVATVKEKKKLSATVEGGVVVMNPEVDPTEKVDTSAKTASQTSAKVSDGVVTVEAEVDKQAEDPAFEKKVSIKKTKDGMVVVEPLVDK